MAKAPRKKPEFVDTAGNEIDTDNPNVVILDEPIKRDGQTIHKVTLIKPTAGTLRGVSLAALAQSEVDALIKVLPRMTYPALTTQELTAINAPDLMQLAGKVIGFLSPASVG
ncbi:phage tail assembly protein [Klebsiella pneumoniae]|uniref:phage tail assembly protein n=1 Tax=Klebsiella pneumoniae TaxID=573 RepID=UPI0039BF399C